MVLVFLRSDYDILRSLVLHKVPIRGKYRVSSIIGIRSVPISDKNTFASIKEMSLFMSPSPLRGSKANIEYLYLYLRCDKKKKYVLLGHGHDLCFFISYFCLACCVSYRN